MPEISTSEEVDTLLAGRAPVAIGVSGGKDSTALALALTNYLNSIGHPRADRILVHADLGLIEWPQSIQWCEKLSERTGTELLVVRRTAGDMIERWEKRWANNWQRFADLQTMKLIVPWSSASLRFCTSELKRDPIISALKKRWPGRSILSACGIRADESVRRSKASVSSPQVRMTSVRAGTRGVDWNPILRWSLKDVQDLHKHEDFPLHPAYTEFGASRVSCSFCVLSTAKDQRAALSHSLNEMAFARLTELELGSAFPFQSTRWLADLDPGRFSALVSDGKRRLENAKAVAASRKALEATLPSDLLFKTGTIWPPRPVSASEAALIARYRNSVFGLYGDPMIQSTKSIRVLLNDRHRAAAGLGNTPKKAHPVQELLSLS